MRLDGVAPFIGGIWTPSQQAMVRDRMFDPKRLWKPTGMTAGDQTAVYFRPDGYWNGAVCMPHQWFVWKALLDHGLASEVLQIAMSALRAYEAEVQRTYHCFEHFIAAIGRGAGWHQFGALSVLLLHWHSACFPPGTVKNGFDGWMASLEWADSRLSARICFLPGPAPVRTVPVVRRGRRLTRAEWKGRQAASRPVAEHRKSRSPGGTKAAF